MMLKTKGYFALNYTISVEEGFMNYKILAEEYFNEANILKNYIKNLKNDKNEGPVDLNLHYRIKMLYDMYLELRNTGEHLMHKFEVTNRE